MPIAADLEPQKSIGDVVNASALWLKNRGVSEARIVSEHLAAALLGLSRTALLRVQSDVADEAFLGGMRLGVLRLAEGEPIQYVVGNWDFRALTLLCDSRALIPRPETEELVGLVLRNDYLRLCDAPCVVDVGTGTGCIALSLAFERPSWRILAIDVEEKALSLARENAVLLNLSERVKFVCGRNLAGAEVGSLDAVVSNPPYIASRIVDKLPSLIRDFEPRSALDGGGDGLGIIRDIVRESSIALKRGGWIFLEIGDDQGVDVRNILEDAGFSSISILPDFAKLTRYAMGRIV